MRKRIAWMAVVLMLIMSVAAAAEGAISAAVQITASRNVCDSVIRVGEDVDMTVLIEGFVPTACQWYREGEMVPGGNQTTLHIDSAEVGDTGLYRMDAMDESGSVRVSADVALRVVDYTIPQTGDTRVAMPIIVGWMGLAAAVAIKILRKKPVYKA